MQDVIYTSRAYAMMPVCLSVCLWHLCTVVTGCDGSRISLQSWIDGCLYYLLTTPDPDHRMGWCRDFWWKGGMEKVVVVAISLILLIFYRLTVSTWRICVYEWYWHFLVISVENALCLKTVRLITTSDHIGLNGATSYVYCRRIKCVTEFA